MLILVPELIVFEYLIARTQVGQRGLKRFSGRKHGELFARSVHLWSANLESLGGA